MNKDTSKGIGNNPIRLVDNGDGTYSVAASITGSLPNQTLAEQKSNIDAVANVITFSETISAIEIYHEETTWQTFIVNGLSLKIPASGYRTPVGGVASANVTVPTSINCIVGRLV